MSFDAKSLKAAILATVIMIPSEAFAWEKEVSQEALCGWLAGNASALSGELIQPIFQDNKYGWNTCVLLSNPQLKMNLTDLDSGTRASFAKHRELHHSLHKSIGGLGERKRDLNVVYVSQVFINGEKHITINDNYIDRIEKFENEATKP